VKSKIQKEIQKVRMGDPENIQVMVNAVIHKGSFNKLKKALESAKSSPKVKVIAGGNCSDEVGWFVEPTVLEVSDPQHPLMMEELFGPVLSIFVYDDDRLEEALRHCDKCTYALTGSVFARDRAALVMISDALADAAGNFYINDKPTGAVVGQQPFGGPRSSGTNDKAGSALNLYRWLNARTIKETFSPPTDVEYPFMKQN